MATGLGFKVLVKYPGRNEFKRATDFVLPRREAMALGQRIAIKTKTKAFRLVPAFGRIAPPRKMPKFRRKMFSKKGRTFHLLAQKAFKKRK